MIAFFFPHFDKHLPKQNVLVPNRLKITYCTLVFNFKNSQDFPKLWMPLIVFTSHLLKIWWTTYYGNIRLLQLKKNHTIAIYIIFYVNTMFLNVCVGQHGPKFMMGVNAKGPMCTWD